VNGRNGLRALVLGLTAGSLLAAHAARSEALLLIEADSGKVLHAENATYPWYPASVTKLMTAYVVLQAVKQQRLSLDTPLTVSRTAHAQAPTKMGFAPGTLVTVDNALKMLMVKSANDIAVVLAEGVSGSVDNFAEEMTRQAHRLGMTQSSFVNPNGLPAEGQVSSARDLAILARALIREFPEYDYYWHIGAIKFGKRVMRNYNTLIGRYAGADGMKTGFICASGFNLVATATRDNKRLIAVVLGAPSSSVRAARAAQLLERGFAQNPLSWLTPSLGNVGALTPINATAPNLRDEMCGPHRKRPAAEDEEDEASNKSNNGDVGSQFSVLLSSLSAPAVKPSTLLADAGPVTPVVVFTGAAKKKPAQAQLASAGAPVAINVTSGAKRSGAAAAASPWTAFSSTALAASPPSDLVATAPGGEVPLPRPRPKRKAKAAAKQ
jgi:D-alanyl-D-alanine carboxypeptidase